jgi:hypothetical protein
MVQCNCGTKKAVDIYPLKSGATKSCGCLAKELRVKRQTKHSATATPEYRVWADMKNRCLNSSLKNYVNYGGRGISVCDEWENSFVKFIEDMGKRPSKKHTLDRVDNNGNYNKVNCRWATKTQQSRNQRLKKSNTSGSRGVSWYKANSKWRVRIGVNGKEVSVGSFNDKGSAIKARLSAELRYWV